MSARCLQIDVADNVDLATVVQAYEEYYESKFGRKPRLSRSPPGDVQVAGRRGATGLLTASQDQKRCLRSLQSLSYLACQFGMRATQNNTSRRDCCSRWDLCRAGPEAFTRAALGRSSRRRSRLCTGMERTSWAECRRTTDTQA